jgi:hypothetical protein
MRCTGVPQTGHGSLKRPWTAISPWKAVTFSGNPSPVCARSRSAHRVSVSRVASYSRANSASVSVLDSLSGDSLAACRISSE